MVDNERFDELTRVVAGDVTPRRTALRLLAGGGLGLLGWFGIEEAGAHDAAKRCRKIEDKKKRTKCLRAAKKHKERRHSQAQEPECETAATCPAPDQQCARAVCTGGACDVMPRSSGTLCRPAAGPCDVDDFCDGGSLVCPNAFRPATHPCQPASCVGGSTSRPTAFCTGNNANCPSTSLRDCGLYVCDFATGTCRTNCSGDSHCRGDAWCDFGICRLRRSNGQFCSAPNQCHSRNCVDGVCCNNACVAPPNARRSCATGTCAFTCNEGFGNCDGDWSDGCEADFNTDPMHCGGCGRPCGGPCNSGGVHGMFFCNGAGQCECSAG